MNNPALRPPIFLLLAGSITLASGCGNAEIGTAEDHIYPRSAGGECLECPFEPESESESESEPEPQPECCADPAPPLGAHPFYPPLDMGTLPARTRGSPYQPPDRPTGPYDGDQNTDAVNVSAESDAIALACTQPGAVVRLTEYRPTTDIHLSGVDDCIFVMPPHTAVGTLAISNSQRIWVRGGGQIAHLFMNDVDDIIISNMRINTGITPRASRTNCTINAYDVNRFALVDSLLRAAPMLDGNGGRSGCGWYIHRAHNVLMARSNFASNTESTSSGNPYFLRLESGTNWLLIDINIKLYEHKMIRFSDNLGIGPPALPVSYVVVRGGHWMHERAADTIMNDQLLEDPIYLADVFVEDTAFYLKGTGLVFGDSPGGFANRPTLGWSARNVHWHTRPGVVSPCILDGQEAEDTDLAAEEGLISYYPPLPPGVGCSDAAALTVDGAHTFDTYPAGPTFPEWPSVPGFANSNPEDTSVMPEVD